MELNVQKISDNVTKSKQSMSVSQPMDETLIQLSMSFF